MGGSIESVTILVTIFMFGLGFGSLLGGFFSKRYSNKIIFIFSVIELITGLYGLGSLGCIKYATTPLLAITVLLTPTLLMGASLPLLVEYVNKQKINAGVTVATLYFFNTLGAALASILTVVFLFELMGLGHTVLFASILNMCIGIAAFYFFRGKR